MSRLRRLSKAGGVVVLSLLVFAGCAPTTQAAKEFAEHHGYAWVTDVHESAGTDCTKQGGIYGYKARATNKKADEVLSLFACHQAPAARFCHLPNIRPVDPRSRDPSPPGRRVSSYPGIIKKLL